MANIMLAPMEGVVDANMRNLLTTVGGIDTCVTEFIRITAQQLPERDLIKKVPELARGSVTSAGVPVVVQFLGSDPEMLAYHAQLAVKLGASAIDLNFGCPSKAVNKHRGGAALLGEPDTLFDIVKKVRDALPETVPLSAKMRLGIKDKNLALENASAIAEGGASSLVVHARTKIEGYRPPAHWQWIDKIRRAVDIKIIANGDIWNWQDYQQCRLVSGCEDVMIGRGLLADPSLALSIKQRLAGGEEAVFDWLDNLLLIEAYYVNVQQQLPPPFVPGRVKQWLNMMRVKNPHAQLLFDKMKQLKLLDEITYLLKSEIIQARQQREDRL
ncbi:MAG: tRNA-dihydrouridine synthase family protein [Oceanospirillaceae bacterium]|nr:tRNA-dihydrouridine synthase family protein [Oceanospirillaceae bacterium]